MIRFGAFLVCALFTIPDLMAQQVGTIAGAVTAQPTGAPLQGANVTVAGTRLAAVTAADGRYLLENVPPGTHHVRVRVIGYAAVVDSAVVVAEGQTTTLDFQLQPQAVELEAIVAIGYATVQRKDVTGALASVSGEDVLLKAAPTTAVSNALQGKAAGVQVVVNSGIPGSGASVHVRGAASIGANSEPLYVIDGLPAMQGTSSQDPTYNPLNELNPSEIESIDVLKDASATAVYGSRGASGVVLITTKRGQRGSDRATIESSYGVQAISKHIPVLSAPQYMTLVNEARINGGLDTTARYTADQIANAQTYNYPELLLRSGLQQNHGITFSGGDDRTRYLLSGSYLKQDGILINSWFERYGLRFNLDREVSDRFRLGTSVSVARVAQAIDWTENGGIGASARGILAAMNFDPSLAPKNANGSWNIRAVLGEQLENPLANISELTDQRNEWRLLGSVFGELAVNNALTLRTTIGTNTHFWRNPYFAPRTIAPGASVNGSATVNSGHDREFINENTISYRRRLGAGTLDFLGGFSAQTAMNESQRSHAENFPVDAISWHDLETGTSQRQVDTDFGDWTLLSGFGRANYNVRDRYLFTVTARRDGSSRFGVNNKWAFFPSAAFAWRISEEPFMQNQRLFDDVKLRLSYGATGNQAVSQYQSLARLVPRFVGIGGGKETVTLVPSTAAANPDLKWETTRQLNVGVDASLRRGRVTISVDAYRSVTRDLLLVVDLPRTTGFNTQLRNVGSVENRGIELAIATNIVQRPSVTWRSAVNLAANRNKVLSLGGVKRMLPGASRYGWFIDGYDTFIVQVGQPLGSIFGYRVNGLWQQGDTCYLTNPSDCTPGEYKIADLDGDGKITPADRSILGYTEPKFYGGLSNSFTAGRFGLDVFLNFTYGNKVANVSNVFSMLATGFLNERAEVTDRWTPTNTSTTIPRANNARPRRLYSTFVEDGSFLRLQTLTLSYDVPRAFIPGTARLYVTGQNLFVLSGYSGFDPEVNSIGGDSRFRGVDAGAYPRARVFNVGISVTF
ncbi:MAG TPA: TonB-dependent receptor [Gemmatimonadales bacterium]|nr:TonB-dependent receptor [Gemmatimonadales bacterium]